MKFQEGYVYHINDDYFANVQDTKLMQNKENGTYRPTFLCLEDRKNAGLLLFFSKTCSPLQKNI